jgi:Tfp pilus assembly protein PilV
MLPINVKPDNKGVSLVEVLMAVVVMLIVFFALMQTALVGIDSNMRNVLRTEAVSAAESRMNEGRNKPFISVDSDSGALSSGGCAASDCPTGFYSSGVCDKRPVKSISEFKFCTNLTCTELGGDNDCATNDADNKQIDVSVGWRWKGQEYTHRIVTIRKR